MGSCNTRLDFPVLERGGGLGAGGERRTVPAGPRKPAHGATHPFRLAPGATAVIIPNNPEPESTRWIMNI